MNKTIAKILSAAVITLAFSSACTKKTDSTSTTTTTTAATPADASAMTSTTTTTTSGSPAAAGAAGTTTATEPKVTIVDTTVGKGTEAVNGKSVTVHYTGTLKDGTQFDTSKGREPFTFTLGSGQVIKGWEQGILGMKVGGKRKLTIPSELAYGNNAVGAIPANSTLMFDVELLDVK
jgi:FKBP-type peptidyl-prolyl cis-trans isomerase